MTQEEKNQMAIRIMLIILIVGFLISSMIQFRIGFKEKTNCEETMTADITQVRKHSARGLVDKTVYYEFVVGDTLYKCTDEFSFFVSYPRASTEIVHYNVQKPSESYLTDTPCGIKNGRKDLIVAIVFGAILFFVLKSKKI